MFIHKTIVVSASIFLIFTITSAESYTVKVIGIKDGDTIAVLHEGREETIRLNGIDCPEKKQAFGNQAKKFTSELVFGKIVNVESVTKDRYGRTVADVITDDGKNINHEIVKNGFAWWYRKYASDDKELERLEKEAKEAKRGLWVEYNPMPPWEYRKLGASQQKTTSSNTESQTQTGQEVEQEYWLNTSSNVRHNRSCQYFGRTKHGRYCGSDEGRPCGKCGG